MRKVISFLEYQNEEVFIAVPEILVIGLISDEDIERIGTIDKGLKVFDGRGLFDGEIRRPGRIGAFKPFSGIVRTDQAPGRSGTRSYQRLRLSWEAIHSL